MINIYTMVTYACKPVIHVKMFVLMIVMYRVWLMSPECRSVRLDFFCSEWFQYLLPYIESSNLRWMLEYCSMLSITFTAGPVNSCNAWLIVWLWFYISSDVRSKILQGVTHWQSPGYFAYFPSNSSIAGFLGEMLSAGINIVGFSWISCPAATELEVIVLDWLAKLLKLPEVFHSTGMFCCIRFSYTVG